MIGIGFRLFADASEFERGVVKAKSSVRALDSEMKVVEKTMNVFAKASGAFGIVAAFSSAISHAQELRDKSRETGVEIGKYTESLARYGDSLDSIKTTALGWVGSFLGSITRSYEMLGDMLRGDDGDIDAIRRQDAQNEKRWKFNDANLKAQKEITKLNRDDAYDRANTQEKITMLANENVHLQEMMDKMSETDVRRTEIKVQMAKNIAEMNKQDLEVQKEKNKKVEESVASHNELMALKRQEKEEDAKAQKTLGAAKRDFGKSFEKIETAKTDRSSMTLQELANLSPFSAGVGVDASNQSRTARDIMDIESKADKARKSGDVEGAKSLFSKADEMRGGLTALKSTERDPGGYKAALKESEEKLKEIADSLKGKFLSQ